VALSDEEALNRILAVDLSSGFIWAELNDQVNHWIERINEHNILTVCSYPFIMHKKQLFYALRMGINMLRDIIPGQKENWKIVLRKHMSSGKYRYRRSLETI